MRWRRTALQGAPRLKQTRITVSATPGSSISSISHRISTFSRRGSGRPPPCAPRRVADGGPRDPLPGEQTLNAIWSELCTCACQPSKPLGAFKARHGLAIDAVDRLHQELSLEQGGAAHHLTLRVLRNEVVVTPHLLASVVTSIEQLVARIVTLEIANSGRPPAGRVVLPKRSSTG
jgi:hypothetical protein